jgi:uncharacterized protein
MVGGFLLGLISVGLGPVLGFSLLKKENENIRVIVSTSIFIVAITTFFASFFYLVNFILKDFTNLLNLLIFSVPGVMIGAKFGTEITHYVKPNLLKTIIACIVTIIGLLLILTR